MYKLVILGQYSGDACLFDEEGALPQPVLLVLGMVRTACQTPRFAGARTAADA